MLSQESSTSCSKGHVAKLLAEYTEWMINYRNSSIETVKKHHLYLMLFLNWLNIRIRLKRPKLATLSHDKVEAFYLGYCSNHKSGSCEQMRSVLRVFLRFCFAKGYVTRDLSIAVPTIRTYRLATIPRAISEDDIDCMLRCIDRKTRAGLRDYAIIQLLRNYGVRSKQIRTLCLNDINWRNDEIHFCSMKYGKEVSLPLIPDVGEALLDYLQHGRPECTFPEVFLTLISPVGPIKTPPGFFCIINRRACAAGLKYTRVGPHMFRHAFATRMLQQKNTLKSIADMLGHRCIQTTYIYTKVDFQNLNQVALEWPEER